MDHEACDAAVKWRGIICTACTQREEVVARFGCRFAEKFQLDVAVGGMECHRHLSVILEGCSGSLYCMLMRWRVGEPRKSGRLCAKRLLRSDRWLNGCRGAESLIELINQHPPTTHRPLSATAQVSVRHCDSRAALTWETFLRHHIPVALPAVKTFIHLHPPSRTAKITRTTATTTTPGIHIGSGCW